MSRSLSRPDPQSTEVDQTHRSPIPTDSASRTASLIRSGLLATGDALSFITFAAIGLHSHHTSDNLLWTAVPFAAGWFLVSPFLGAFSPRHTSGLKQMLRRTEIAWLAAWPLALVLRFALSADHTVPLSFALVILIVNAIFLGLWRGAFAAVAGWLGGRGKNLHKEP